MRDLLASISPLTARSVLATALLGADEPKLSVSELLVAAALFGIRPGAARTCLSRMVAQGELTSDNASYALTGHLLERRRRIDDAARTDPVRASSWNGGWELAVVALDRRSAIDRLELRKAATALHLAELKEGVWIRPDNLDRQRLPGSRAVLDRQCVHFWGAESAIDADAVSALFGLDAWARDARRLIEAMNDELELSGEDRGATHARLSFGFALSIAVVRHLQLDPLLPTALLPADWPAALLRSTYRRFDGVLKRQMNEARSANQRAGAGSR